MLKSLLKNLLCSTRFLKGSLPKHRNRSRSLGLERLEDRLNPASTLTLSGTTLVITAAAGETLTLSASSGQIIVTDSLVNGLKASGGAVGSPLNFGNGPATSLTSNDAGGLQNDTTNVTAIDVTGPGTVKLGGSNVLNAS